MSRLAIVNPPFISGDRVGYRAGCRWPSTGTSGFSYFYCPYPFTVGYTASYLKSMGHDVMYYDAIGRRHGYDKFYSNLRQFNPEYVIQEISWPSINLDLGVARNISSFAKVVLCGTHASVIADELIKLDYVHSVFEGVYEEHALELANTGEAKIYRKRPMENLDKYPYPIREEWMKGDSRHNFEQINQAYTAYYDPCHPGIPEPQLWMLSGRGCPFKCSFCLWPNTLFNNQVQWRDVDKVVAEIKYYKEEHGYRSVYFDDDTGNARPWPQLKALCDGLAPLDIPWLFMGRLDLSTEEQFKYIADHGCAGMRIGVETLSQRQLDAMHKGFKVEDIKEKIRYLNGITNLYLLFMHGYPGETEDDRRATEDFIKEIGCMSQNPACIPFKGVPYYDEIAAVVPEIRDIPPMEFDGNNVSGRLLNIIKLYGERTSK